MTSKRMEKFEWCVGGWLVCLLLLMVGVIPGGIAVGFEQPVGAPEMSASEVVTKFHKALIESMKAGEEAGDGGRYGILEPVVRESYDFKTISRTVLGSSWKTISEEERVAFVDVFSKFTIATYASRFDGYHGEKFETISEKERRKNLRMVHSVFTDGRGKARSFDYQMLFVKKQLSVISYQLSFVSCQLQGAFSEQNSIC